MCGEKKHLLFILFSTINGKKILSLPEGKHFPFHGKCQSKSVCLQKQQNLDCAQRAVAVREGRKKTTHPQERPHPLLEVYPISFVLRGRNRIERKWG